MRLPILMYHKIGKSPPGALVPHHYVTPRQFERHVKALLRFGFQTVRLEEDPNTPSKPIALTFDDGYENFRTGAFPILQALGQTATVFVVTGLLGRANDWDTRIGDRQERLMSAEAVTELATQGIQFGSHTATHPRLTELSHAEADAEIVKSRATLHELLSEPVETFCYPYGAHDQDVRRLVREAGYKRACSVEKGWNSEETDPFRLKRINVRSDTSTPILFWKLWRQSRRGSAVA